MNTLKPFRKAAALLMSAALCCSTAALLTGCSDDGDVRHGASHSPEEFESVYMPEVPDSRVDDNAPGNDTNGKIGEATDYDGKLSVTVQKVIELDDVDKTQFRTLLVEMTIVNNSDSKIDCQSMTHFRAVIDGTEEYEPVKDVRAQIAARKYYSKIGSDLQIFNQEVAAGETVKGYVCLGMPTSWKTLDLVYTPYKYFNNDHIIYTIQDSDIEHYDALLG